MDEYGAAECNAIFIGDSEEVWYFEIVSGHQYAAVKLDPSKVSVVPNMMMGQIDLNDTGNVVASEDLIKVAKAAGSYVTENPENPNSIHIAKSYSEGNVGHSSYRAWMGMNVLNPELAETVDPNPAEGSEAYPNADAESADGPFYLQFDPSEELAEKIDLKTMIRVLQARGEGTEYPASEGYYPIANNHQAEDHIFQIRQDLPASIATIHWQAMGPAEFSIFVPYYTAAMSQTPEIYHNESDEFTEDSMYWVFDELAILCNNNRDTNVDEVVSAYFSEVQDCLIAQQKSVDRKMQILAALKPNAVTAKAEELADDAAEQVYAIALNTLHEVQAYLESGSEEDFALETTDLPDYGFAKSTGLSPEDFTDLSADAWYYEAVEYVLENSMMTGFDDNTFRPNAQLSRAMLAQILYNMEGRPATSGTAAFSDVAAGAWYTDAVNWAAASGIVTGAAGKSALNDNITREQMAAILYRYTQLKGPNAAAQQGKLTGFVDEDQISTYAIPAMNWAVEQGLMIGKDGSRLAPKDTATRAEVAKVLMNYCKIIAQ